MYSQKVMEHFKHPHNLREIKNADGIGKVGNPICLHPTTIIHANDSLISINEVKRGNYVLGHKGLYNRVLRTTKRRYNGKLIEIKDKLGSTYTTPEHMIYAVKLPKSHWFSLHQNKKKFPVGWYHANELEKNDLVVYPIIKETKNQEFLVFEQKRKKWDFRSIRIPDKIPLNGDFLRLVGYYLSEGSLREIVTKTYLTFTFNTDEEDLAEDVINIVKALFGIEAKKKVKSEKNTLIVEVNNVWVTRLFSQLFGKGASKKRIPHQLMLLDPEKQKSLIYGLWKGDGYFNKKKPRAGYSTISKELCQQIKLLLIRQKIVPSVYVEEEKVKENVRHRKAYRIHIGERKSLEYLAKILKIEFRHNKKTAIDSWFDENYLYVPITKINKKSYKGYVHNLEIENSKSYLTESLAVHNCGDLMWVYIKVKKNKQGKGYIEDIGVKTFGCVAAIATSSMITDLAKGKTLEEAKKISRDDIKDALDGLPPIKVHCSNLSADGLHKAIKDYEKKKKAT